MSTWREVSDAPGYQVSDGGQVRSFRRYPDGRLLKPGPAGTNGEYYNVVLMIDGRPKNKLVHRLVLEAFVGPCPEGMEARHKNGNSTDNAVSNLEWATHMDNMQDKVAHGTLNRNRRDGNQHEWSRLNAGQVEQIRVEYASGSVTQQQLADKYGTSRANIGLIVNRKNWKKV